MKKDSKPICQQDGVFAHIQSDDRNSEFCLISGKRVDTVWGQWGGEETVYDPPDWKLVNRRETVIEAAHEGILDLGDSERALEWIKFVDQEMTWEDAKANCETLGGTLFSRVDGTEEQLDFLLEKMIGWGSTLMIMKSGNQWLVMSLNPHPCIGNLGSQTMQETNKNTSLTILRGKIFPSLV